MKRHPSLLEGLRRREPRALARALTLAERDPAAAWALAAALPEPERPAIRVGITGAPGTGKSTLVGALLEQAAGLDQRIAVLAIDPSSPLSGGALLADRLRMPLSPKARARCFIRSIASRGHWGGVSPGTGAALDLLTRFDFEVILVETIGVGQGEVEVMDWVDRVLLLLVGGLGDEIQLAKSGITEIVDAFVVNKCRQPGAERLEADLRAYVRDAPRFQSGAQRSPEVFSTDALAGDGVAGLWRWLTAPSAPPVFPGRGAANAWGRQRQRMLARLQVMFLREADTALRQLPRSKVEAHPPTELMRSVLVDMLSRMALPESPEPDKESIVAADVRRLTPSGQGSASAFDQSLVTSAATDRSAAADGS